MRCILEALLPHVPALVCDEVKFNLPALDAKVDDFVITSMRMADVPPEFKEQPFVFLNTRIHPAETAHLPAFHDVDLTDWECERCGGPGSRRSQMNMCGACYAEEQFHFPMLARARPVTLPLGTT